MKYYALLVALTFGGTTMAADCPNCNHDSGVVHGGAFHGGACHGGACHHGGCHSGACRGGNCDSPSPMCCRPFDRGCHNEYRHYQRAQYYPWHGSYYDPAWGTPYALVVPPTVRRQTNWGWSVGTTRRHEIDHQFGRGYPGPHVGGTGFAPVPQWPSDTTQLGVYYVRGPWK